MVDVRAKVCEQCDFAFRNLDKRTRVEVPQGEEFVSLKVVYSAKLQDGANYKAVKKLNAYCPSEQV